MDSIPKLIRKNLKIGAFIGLFLFVFKPFGLPGYANHEQVVRCIGFGLITFAINTAFEIAVLVIRKKYLKPKNWTTKDAILKVITSIVLISIGNALFFVTLNTESSFLAVYLDMLASTFVIGSLPALFFLNFQQLESLRGNEQKIAGLNQQLERVTSERLADRLIQFPNENGEVELQLPASKILYIKSESNYLEIHVDNTQRPERHLLRNRIKTLEELLPNNFIRCHRSYIVNRDKIKKVEGSKRGYQLLFESTTNRVPVSRGKTERFKAIIKGRAANL